MMLERAGNKWVRYVYVIVALVAVFTCILFVLARKEVPDTITYGMSFNTPYALELGLEPREVYDAFLDELQVRHLRLAAHWTLIEPRQDQFDFSELDYQIARAESVGATVILAVGRRLPRWPECHVPPWAQAYSWDAQKEELREYLTAVVSRYKESPAITYWQIENEPYLEVFAKSFCGELDEAFLEEEIEIVRSLDETRPILLTDSGNLGSWYAPYQRGDAFGTSVYVYFWNPELGQFRTILPAWLYRVKENLMALRYGKKPTLLIELSAEPWLLEPVTEVPIAVQFERMDVEKFDEILTYAAKTRFDTQYLWGGEWWYWLRKQGDAEMWERGRTVFMNEF